MDMVLAITELSIVRVIENTVVRDYLLWFFKTNHFIINSKVFSRTADKKEIHKGLFVNVSYSSADGCIEGHFKTKNYHHIDQGRNKEWKATLKHLIKGLN